MDALAPELAAALDPFLAVQVGPLEIGHQRVTAAVRERGVPVPGVLELGAEPIGTPCRVSRRVVGGAAVDRPDRCGMLREPGRLALDALSGSAGVERAAAARDPARLASLRARLEPDPLRWNHRSGESASQKRLRRDQSLRITL